ncbi:hypothetical protein MMC22_011627 [Lobaria immixta]|nr:hypothetical protein [Lobaria immixta]
MGLGTESGRVAETSRDGRTEVFGAASDRHRYERFACTGLEKKSQRDAKPTGRIPSRACFSSRRPTRFSVRVVLVVQPTADGAAARQPLRNVFPLHARAPELDSQHIFLRAPFGLLLGRQREWVRRGGRAALVRGPRDGGREPRVGGRGGRRSTAGCDEGDQGAKTSPEITFGVARRRSCVVDK